MVQDQGQGIDAYFLFFFFLNMQAKVEGIYRRMYIAKYLSGEAFLASEKGPEGVTRKMRRCLSFENDCFFFRFLYFLFPFERRWPEAKSAGLYINDLI